MSTLDTVRYFGELALDRLEDALKAPEGKVPTTPPTTTGQGSILAASSGWANTPVKGTAELVKAYKESPWVRAAVGKIAMKFASVEWKLYGLRSKPRSNKLVDATWVKEAGVHRHEVMAELKDAGLLVEVDTHPLLDLMRTPNPYMSGLSARRLLITYFDLVGDSYWALERSPSGVVLEAWPVPPDWVTELPSSRKPYYTVSWGQGSVLKVNIGDMFSMRDLDPSNPYGAGAGVGRSLGDEIDIDGYASKFIGQFFVNRAKPELMVAIEGASDDALKRAQHKFDAQNRGFWRAYRTFWHRGKMTVKELTQKFMDMQVNELRKAERDAIVHAYGIPPELFGLLESSNRATITEARKILATEVIVPRCEIYRSEFQRQLVEPTDPRLWYDYVNPMPRDRDFQLSVFKANPSAPTRGEWRVLGDLEDRGKGDNVHISQSGEVEEAPKVEPVKTRAFTLDTKAPATMGDVENALDALRPMRLASVTLPVMEEELGIWAQAELDDLGVEASFDMTNPLITEHLEDFGGARIEDINATTRDQLRRTLAQGVKAGEGARDLAKRVKDKMGQISDGRARTIARTETTRTANFGTHQAFKQSGIVEGKEWVSTIDSRTRDGSGKSNADHKRSAPSGLNGQVRKLNERFLAPSGLEALHPGGFNDGSEDCNCRCTIVASFDGKAADRALVEQKAKNFQDEVAPWEDNLLAAFRKGFAQQTSDVVKELLA